MSFVNQRAIQSLIEDLIQDIWPVTGYKFSTPVPFPRMSFTEAVTKVLINPAIMDHLLLCPCGISY